MWGVALLVAAVVAPVAGLERVSMASFGLALRHPVRHAHGWHGRHGAYGWRAGRNRGPTAPHGSHAHGPHLTRRLIYTPPAPEATWSRYMSTVSPGRLRRLGCGLGAAVGRGHERPDALVVLAFGMPQHHRSRFGASLFDGRFSNSKKIGRATVAYAAGFARCLGGRPGHLTLAAGTSNYGGDVTFRHGQAWGSMVNRSNGGLRRLGIHRAVQITGANDIEPGWRGPVATRSWIRGYDSVTDTPYFDFGGAAGCPPIGRCEGGWSLEDVWYAAWGSGVAVPLPEIYANTGANAEQWYHVALYSVLAHRRRMEIGGVMSQLQSCWDHHDPCRGISDTPRNSWGQLWRALNSDPRTAQPLRFSTNISWRN
ncbi:MAG: hypothetical protein ACJ77A_09435 [Actinomycetota bacterium]